ncbi:MAG: helix-turn-helix domain-containing protein [Desulfomonilaceae bacterium]|nr:helix-turn-helix domain-containing protein [Desulfomonilaceae bacterium]
MVDIKPLKEIRREYIQQVLRSTNGDLERAGEILGVSTVALRRMIKEHGLSLDETEGHDKD